MTLLKFMNIKFAIIMVMVAIGMATSEAQNLTASQMNIYFGHPKSATTTNSQGTVTAEFDRDGKILSITQGNIRQVYDWADDCSMVTVSMYLGQNFQDAGIISITTFTKERYEYVVGEDGKVIVDFKNNGAVDEVVMSDSQMTSSMKYFYHNADEAYPYAIEMAMGEQSVRAEVTINETDTYGNATEYTQGLMGMSDTTHVSIEYY